MEPVDFQKWSVVRSTRTEVLNFCAEKVFHCTCLIGTVTECWQEGLRTFDQIYDRIN